MGLLNALDKIAQKHNVPVVQVAINWSTQNPIVDTALLEVRNPQEAKENCAAMSWELNNEEISIIHDAIYNTDWN